LRTGRPRGWPRALSHRGGDAVLAVPGADPAAGDPGARAAPGAGARRGTARRLAPRRLAPRRLAPAGRPTLIPIHRHSHRLSAAPAVTQRHGRRFAVRAVGADVVILNSCYGS